MLDVNQYQYLTANAEPLTLLLNVLSGKECLLFSDSAHLSQ